jgi:choline-sulfatase
MDAQIGRILEALDATGKREDTYIIFTADHGLSVGHHGLIGKQNMYDHSVRVPFIVCGPSLEAGRHVDASIYLQDVMPTTLEMAEVEKPEHVQFHSLVPLLRGETKEHAYDAVYGAYTKLQRAVTYDGFKLIVYPEANRVRLFNLKQDPLEQNDLAEVPEHRATKKRLFQRLLKLQIEMHDPVNLESMLAEI